MADIIIGNDDYYEILAEVGYPVIPEGAFEYNRQQILQYVVVPALREYWSWFPIEHTTSTFVAGSDFDVPYPTLDNPSWNVIGIVDGRLTTRQQSNSDTGSVFLNSIITQVKNSGRYGTAYDYGYESAKWYLDAYQRSSQNSIRALRLHVHPETRNVTGFANTSGELILTWGIGSTRFDDIPYTRKTEVLNLCKSKILGLFYRLRTQMDAGTGVSFNGEAFKTRADTLEERTLTKWREFSKVTIIKS